MSNSGRTSLSSRRTSTSNKAKEDEKTLLQRENERLREEVLTLKKLLSAPIDQTDRQVQYRYQIYALEKQIALLTRLLDAKREAVATCETILLELSETLQ